MFKERVKLFLLLMLALSASFFMVALFFHPSVRPSLPLWIAVVVLGAALGTWIIGVLYLKPLERLAAKVARMPEETITFPEGNLRRDEVGVLARRLNEMADVFRAEVEKAIAEKEEVRAVITSMSEGVLVVAANKRILHASNTVIRMLDLRSGNPYGRFYWEVLRHEEVVVLVEESLEATEPLKREMLLSPEGLSLSIHTAPVLVGGGKLHSVVVVFHDISALRKYDRMRSEFVANVSHELKTPLTSIKGFAETLRSGAIDDRESALRFLGIIEAQALRLEKLVSDILFLSAVEAQESAGEMPAKEPQSVSGIIREVLDTQQPLIDARGHKVTVDVPESLPRIMGDRAQLDQVFLNLVHNAIKFTPDHGEIAISARNDKGMLCIDIKDSGIGIPPEHFGRLFERFYRVDKDRSQEMGGTGLGLAIVKHIVHWHGGYVSVHSLPSQGTTFSVFLPKA
jgi:two-component system phosphate regulon sensor histidine kinase PhoR